MNKLTTRLCLLLAGVLTVGLLGGCVSVNFIETRADDIVGKGDVVDLEFPAESYSEIVIDANLELIYSADPKEIVELSLHENLVQYMEVEVSGGVLTVRSTRRISTNNSQAPTLTVYCPQLKRLTVDGVVELRKGDTITGESFALDVLGVCSIDQRIEVDRFTASLAGVGSIDLRGSAREGIIDISGINTLNARNLEIADLTVSLNGIGDATVWCTESLDASVEGMGSLSYRGAPTNIYRDISGMGTINQVN